MNENASSSNRRQFLGAATSAVAASVLAPSVRPARANAATVAKTEPVLKPGVFTAAVDDVQLYCEVRGAGPIMILQNGVWQQSFTEYFSTPFMQELSKNFTVLTFDGRGQGRSTGGQGPTNYGRFAADTVRLMDKLGIHSAHFIGHSDGGCIQLNLLVDFADRVRTATLLGTPYSHDAYNDKTKEEFRGWFDQIVSGAPLDNTPELEKARKHYQAVSPEPQRFEEMSLKRRKCWATEPNISLRQLGAIDRPVLVVDAGKDEYIPSEQFKVLAKAIPGARSVSLPEMTHNIRPYMAQIAKAVVEFTAKH